jgi:hypothetical protein
MSIYIYLPISMVSPKVTTERMTEQTVLMGLNVETKTGPLFFIAHPLKLIDAPLTAPPCAFKYL